MYIDCNLPWAYAVSKPGGIAIPMYRVPNGLSIQRTYSTYVRMYVRVSAISLTLELSRGSGNTARGNTARGMFVELSLKPYAY